MSEIIQQTKEFVKGIDKKVAWIGSEDEEYQLTFEEFLNLEPQEYDQGYGAQEVAQDLIIVFEDGSTAIRQEYDGSEGWQYNPYTSSKVNKNRKKFSRVIVKPSQTGWEDLKSINEKVSQ